MVKTMFQFFRKVYNFLIIVRLIYKHGIENLLRDPLTGIHNRIPLKEFGEREIRRAKRYKRHLYCIMIDIDGLKIINDGEGGHAAGDKALRIIANVLKKNCRETDLIFRFGGDEFIILMSETNKSGVKQFLKRVVEELRGFSLSASMGSYFWRKDMTLEKLIEKADMNLYMQKDLKKKKPDAI
jgi:diguanylate cyclase (GGDEF)-like protein